MPKRPRSKKLAAAAKRRRGATAEITRSWKEGYQTSAFPAEDAPIGGSTLGAIIDDGLSRFEEYYRPEKFVGDGEWQKLLNTLRQPMPVAFRLCVGRGQPGIVAKAELEQLLEKIEAAGGFTTARGRFVPPPKRFGFVDAVAIGCDQKVLKHEQHEASSSLLARLGKWIIKKSAEGLISRQEIVSAVPVALLDVQPCHAVLDMCASPGSKTLQALERVGGQRSVTNETTQGLVVANEISATRGHILSARCLRLKDSCAHFMVTQHGAQTFPGPAGFFDRIICDVPCSGDAAIRKFPEKWRDWSPRAGRMLHSLQLQIVLRAAVLLRVGGVLSYSTCSFNPLENEAVVSALLSKTGGALELIVCPPLDGLELRPGISTWHVSDEVHGRFKDYADAMGKLPKQERRRYRRTMWPTIPAPPLERCIRLLPHLRNTGGFFIAVLRKVKAWPPPPPCPVVLQTPHALRSGETLPRPCPPEVRTALLPILKHLATEDAENHQLFMRGRNRVFFCVTPLANLLAQSSGMRRRLSLVSIGTCVAERCSNTDWRLTAAGEQVLLARPASNKKAIAKLSELHRCVGCLSDLPASSFSRKMLTRPLDKRKCSNCVNPPVAKVRI